LKTKINLNSILKTEFVPHREETAPTLIYSDTLYPVKNTYV